MPRLGDIVLLGPRLTVAVVRRAADVATGSVRLAAGIIREQLDGDRSEPSVREPEVREPEPARVGDENGRDAVTTPHTADDADEGEDEEPEIPEVNPNVPQAVGGGFPEPPGKDPGDISNDPAPHHALNTPVGDPDPTEWPDPYEKREDPRDPPDPDEEPFGEEPHPQVGSTSTSEPHPSADIAAPDAEPPERDKLDD